MPDPDEDLTPRRVKSNVLFCLLRIREDSEARVSTIAPNARETRLFAHLSLGRRKANGRRRRGVCTRSDGRVGAERAACAEGAVLAGLRGEGREPGRRRSRILSRDKQTGVGGSLLVHRLHGDVGDAREAQGEEERDK